MFFNPPKSRHPERSAPKIYRTPEALLRGVEGPRPCLLADALQGFLMTNYNGNRKSYKL
jgi:hypothetical protein